MCSIQKERVGEIVEKENMVVEMSSSGSGHGG